MKRYRVTVPAALDGLGPGAGILGLALDLVDTVEVELEDGSDEVAGDEVICAAYSSWPAERLPGARFTLQRSIPQGHGLGEDTASIVAGLAAAAAATESKDARATLFRLGLQHGARPSQLTACVMGGVTTALCDGDDLYGLHVADHLTMDISIFLPDRPPQIAPLPADPARLAYLLTALMWGRWDWLDPAMRIESLPDSLTAVLDAASAAGAYGTATCGPTPYALAPHTQGEEVARAMETRARDAGLPGRAIATTVREAGVQVKALTAEDANGKSE